MSTPLGTLLRPALEREQWHTTELGRFIEYVEKKFAQSFADYDELWQWSVDNVDDFWQSIWDYFNVISHSHPTAVLEKADMPGALWFPGASINYAEHVARALSKNPTHATLIGRSQTVGSSEWTAQQILDEIAKIRTGLVRMGVTKGDRVVGYVPNIPQAVAAYMATLSLGAIWCSVPPEMGPQSVLDRISQLEPSVMIAIDGYVWGNKTVTRTEEIARIQAELPNMKLVLLPYLAVSADYTPKDSLLASPASALPSAISYADFTADQGELAFEPVPFDHPMVILFSSGTTGKPKAIVHGHGGLLLEHFKMIGLHFDISAKDRTFWYSTTGWMMWNLSVSSLLTGASMVLMDGDPNYPTIDGPWSQWAILAETESTYFSTASAYLAACAHAGLKPAEKWDISRLREIQCSGSPLSPDVAAWVTGELGPQVMIAPVSGGTDICSAFVTSSPVHAVYAGEMATRPLGTNTQSWSPERTELLGEPGELVCVAPIPSMPVKFWGDDNFERYLGSYFDTWPGIWRHGDWLVHTERNTWVITGRSDATLNRGGVRLGTAEFYTVLDRQPEIDDSLVVHFEDKDGGMGKLILLVSVTSDVDREAEEKKLRTLIRSELSPRHVPDVVVWVDSVPRTATGKRLEIPLKRLVQGIDTGNTIDRGVLVHPEHLDATVEAIRSVL